MEILLMYEVSRELNKEQGVGLSLPTHASVSDGTSKKKNPLLDCPRDVMHDGPLSLSCRHQYDSGSSEMYITVVTNPKKTD
jgi:hypothetical protein